MKKSILIALATITLFACNPNKNETTSTTDDAGMSDFKENSKVILDGFENFSKNDLKTFSTYISDTVKVHGPTYGEESIANKTILIQRLERLSYSYSFKVNELSPKKRGLIQDKLELTPFS
jgi:hypothetical protein